MGKEVSSYAQSPACAPASRSNSRFYLSGKAAALPAPHAGFRVAGASRLGLWWGYWVGYWFSVSPRSSFIVCLTRRAVVTSR